MEEERTILIVDDEKSIVDILKFNLEKEGYISEKLYINNSGLVENEMFCDVVELISEEDSGIGRKNSFLQYYG